MESVDKIVYTVVIIYIIRWLYLRYSPAGKNSRLNSLEKKSDGFLKRGREKNFKNIELYQEPHMKRFNNLLKDANTKLKNANKFQDNFRKLSVRSKNLPYEQRLQLYKDYYDYCFTYDGYWANDFTIGNIDDDKMRDEAGEENYKYIIILDELDNKFELASKTK